MKEFNPPVVPEKETLGEIMTALGTIEDRRQSSKVKYPIADVILLVVAAVAGKAETWVDIEDYGRAWADLLKKYLNIQNIPSHDTIQRVMQMINSAVLARIYQLWCQKMDFPEETPETLRGHKLLNIDGKTIRGSSGRGHKAIHVESAWDPQRGVCVGQTAVGEKSNEITAIPKVLANLDLHGYIVTSDAMGTQVAIARQITEQGGDYLLALKGNQGSMYEDMQRLSEDREFLDDLRKDGKYYKKREKAHGQIETREYWQTDDLGWLAGKDKWSGIQSVGFERTTIKKDGNTGTSWRFFLCSFAVDAEMFAAAVRGHWRIEAMHHVLDVALREDANRTLERTAAENLNIIRKWVISILRHVDPGSPVSMRRKSYRLGLNPEPALEMLKQPLAI